MPETITLTEEIKFEESQAERRNHSPIPRTRGRHDHHRGLRDERRTEALDRIFPHSLPARSSLWTTTAIFF